MTGLIHIFICLIAAAFAEPSIHVRPRVQLPADRTAIRLGDVAEIKGFSSVETKALAAIVLGDAPKEDESRTLTNFALSDVLRGPLEKIERGHDGRVALLIPKHVFIEKQISAHRIADAIRTNYMEACDHCDIRVSNIAMPPVTGPVDSWKIDFPDEIPKGSFSIPIELNQNGKASVIWTTGKLSVFKKVAVADRNISIGERIQPSDIVKELRDVTYATDNPAATSELVGAMAARGIAAHQVIWKSALVRPRALNRGDVVRVVSGGSAWEISVSGIAQQPGYIGDTVQVTNASTQKTLTGVVIDKDVVRVQ